jgi:hypothetical protein
MTHVRIRASLGGNIPRMSKTSRSARHPRVANMEDRSVQRCIFTGRPSVALVDARPRSRHGLADELRRAVNSTLFSSTVLLLLDSANLLVEGHYALLDVTINAPMSAEAIALAASAKGSVVTDQPRTFSIASASLVITNGFCNTGFSTNGSGRPIWV